MTVYDEHALGELKRWQKAMRKRPTWVDRLTRSAQVKMNKIIPEKIHVALTSAIKQMVKGVLFGAKYTAGKKVTGETLQQREASVQQRIEFYKKTAAAEGGITGAGSILLAIADFPLLLGIKMKMLFEIAALYGYDVKDYKERLFILYVFQFAFSSRQHKAELFKDAVQWPVFAARIPIDVNEFNWRSFQQEYRDYIDLAKMLQLVPGIGAIVGVVVNYKLLNKLGETEMNAYRMRWQQDGLL